MHSKIMYAFLRFIGHQNWIRYGFRYHFIKLFVPINKIDKNFEVPFFGLKYSGNIKYSIDWSIFFFGAYEKVQLLWVQKLLIKNQKNGIALDIGANVGNHSLFFSTFFKQVNSFEPYPPIFERLQKQVTSNKLKNVILHPLALSDSNGTTSFYPPQTNNIGMGTLDNKRAGNNALSINVDIVNGDNYCKQHKITSVDFIKIDVEGHELEVFKGLTDLIQSNKPYIWFEFSPNEENDDKMWIFNNLLRDYNFYRLDYFLPLNSNDIENIVREVDILAYPKQKK